MSTRAQLVFLLAWLAGASACARAGFWTSTSAPDSRFMLDARGADANSLDAALQDLANVDPGAVDARAADALQADSAADTRIADGAIDSHTADSVTYTDANQVDASASDTQIADTHSSDQVPADGAGAWGPDAAQQAYIKASNIEGYDHFGNKVALSGDGNTIAVSAPSEDSGAIGVGGDEQDNSRNASGAVYIFGRAASTWVQQAYIKASNPDEDDGFGFTLALAHDGNTLAVGVFNEDSNATGVDGNQSDNSSPASGAVYVCVRVGTTWSQQAYIKASNTNTNDIFAWSVALAGDGNTLAVGAPTEASNAVGIDGDQSNNNAAQSGAVYVFGRGGSTWTQQAYVKASNTNSSDRFGTALRLNSDGSTLAVGAPYECSNATGIDGNQSDNSMQYAGAAYVFTRNVTAWSQQAYIKASNSNANDLFGYSIALAGDGNVLVVSARTEASAATGIDGDQSDNSAANAGAVYVLARVNERWSQSSYIKASNTDADDYFGDVVALSASGNTLVVGTRYEASQATGINGDESDNSVNWAGAAYVLVLNAQVWSQQSYVKAAYTDTNDFFATSVAVSANGSTIVVGAPDEDGSSAGINGDENDNSVVNAGAVYVFE